VNLVAVSLLTSISKHLIDDLAVVGAESWQVGTTKLFIRRDLSDKLDRLLWVRLSVSSRIVQVQTNSINKK
jgi:hypothetical protein